MVVNKKESVRTKKATVRTKSTKTAVTDVVSLEGVVKSPGGSNKKITISIPSIEYPVCLLFFVYCYCYCLFVCLHVILCLCCMNV